jgi:hypothetical protein
VTFVVAVANVNNKNLPGYILGPIAFVAMCIGFILGFLLMELYIFLLFRKTRNYEELLKSTDKGRVNTYLLDMVCRILMGGNEESTQRADKLLKLAMLYGMENARLHLTQGAYHLYFRSDRPTLAVQSFRKSLTFRPNFIIRVSVLLRFGDIDMEINDESDERKATQVILQGRDKQKQYQLYVQAFWKELVEEKVNYQKLSKIIYHAESAYQDTNRIYNTMIGSFAKKPNAIRAYADYLDTVEFDRDSCYRYLQEVEVLEEQQHQLDRLRRKVFETNLDTAGFSKRNSVVPVVMRENSNSSTDSTEQLSTKNLSIPHDRHNNHQQQKDDCLKNQNMDLDDLMDDNDLESADEMREKMNRKEDLMHRSIKSGHNYWLLRCIVLSLSIAVIIYLIVLIAVQQTKMVSIHTNYLMRACRLQTQTYETFNLWRQMQMNSAFNTSLTPFLDAYTVEIIESHAHTVETYINEGINLRATNDQHRRDALVSETFMLQIPVIELNTINLSYDTNITLYDASK